MSSLLSHQDDHSPRLCTQWCLWTPPSWSWYHAGCWKALETGNQTGKEEEGGGGGVGEMLLTVMFISPKEFLVIQHLSHAVCERKINCITCTIYVCLTRHYEHFTWAGLSSLTHCACDTRNRLLSHAHMQTRIILMHFCSCLEPGYGQQFYKYQRS